MTAATLSSSTPKVTLHVSGMNCASCVGRIEAALSKATDTEQIVVNLATKRAIVTGTDDAEGLVRVLGAAGYESEAINTDARSAGLAHLDDGITSIRLRFWIAALLTAPVFLMEMGGHIWPPFHHAIVTTIGLQASWTVQAVLTGLVLVGPGLEFYRKGLPALLRGTPEMNSLVALGTLAAYLFSLVALLAPNLLPDGTVHVYFEAAAMIVTLVLLGRWLEARAKGRSSAAIAHLIELQPRTALVLQGDDFIEIPIDDVTEGATLLLQPGARAPVDGEVLSGAGLFDESMITGEPMPVSKERGAQIIGGTINQSGALHYRADAVGADMVLSQIISMVQDAQASRLPIEALVDRVTAWFVPLVLGLAALTFIVWMALGPAPAMQLALVNAIAVLIIACPCAMGLATPMSVMVATGRAAEKGILFARGDALQRLRDIKVVALDKTGTLTKGTPSLTDMIIADGIERDDCLAAIAAVEQASEHPLASAVIAEAKEQGLHLPAVERFESIVGKGVRALVNGQVVAIGSGGLMAELGLEDADLTQRGERLAEDRKSVFYAGIGGRLAAILAVADPIKPDAAATISYLKSQSLMPIMLTGDAERTAKVIARQLGIGHVQARLLPGDKLKSIQTLTDAYGPVAFVGDGINDAPALAQASVGIALGTGTDVAMEAADVVLMSGSLSNVARAFTISNLAMRNIRQNLIWAFGYNALLIPVAAGLIYPGFGLLLSPVLAAGAMALSSVFVVSNALRLRRVIS